MRVKDELLKNFSEATAPANSFASAAEANSTTYPARASFPSGEPRTLPSLFAGENRGPDSNLPENISAASIATRSLERTYNMGPGNRSPLAGTEVRRSDNTGDGLVSGALNALSDLIDSVNESSTGESEPQ